MWIPLASFSCVLVYQEVKAKYEIFTPTKYFTTCPVLKSAEWFKTGSVCSAVPVQSYCSSLGCASKSSRL